MYVSDRLLFLTVSELSGLKKVTNVNKNGQERQGTFEPERSNPLEQRLRSRFKSERITFNSDQYCNSEEAENSVQMA